MYKILANNPLFSLFLVFLYISLMWSVIIYMWRNENIFLAAITFLIFTFLMKKHSKKIIKKLKDAKTEQF